MQYVCDAQPNTPVSEIMTRLIISTVNDSGVDPDGELISLRQTVLVVQPLIMLCSVVCNHLNPLTGRDVNWLHFAIQI